MLPISTSGTGVDTYLDWLKGELARTDYGEIGLRFVVHQGMITRVCKHIEVPEKMGVPVKFEIRMLTENGGD